MGRIILLFMLCCLFTPIHEVAARSTPDAVFRKRLDADARGITILRDALRRSSEFARSRPDLFDPPRERRRELLSRDDKMAIWTTWSGVLDGMAGLDAIRRSHGSFQLFQERERRTGSFHVAYAAFLAGYRHALEFIALTDRNPALDTVLNEAVPELGIPAGTFGRFKFRFLNLGIASEFAALQAIASAYGPEQPGLRQGVEEDRRVIWGMGKGKGYGLTLKNAFKVVNDIGFSAWFPLQRGVSEWMGDTKVVRRHSHLISPRQISDMGRRLQPGDIIFERHEWYLSNLGLPGFWTHVALYVGTPEERRRFFNTPELREWARNRGAGDGDFESLLRKRYPQAYERSRALAGDGNPPRILEAISEGVSFTSLEFTGASDSIGVIRPRLSRRDKALAILRAFHFSGRPYDFNFDFQTDAALVCSELVFKAYAAEGGTGGMRFPLTQVLGRSVSTPNDMVRQFDAEQGSPAPQAEFVLFLDGFEKEQRAVESTPEQFRGSWKRPNWHILIQDAPVEAKR